MTPIKLSGDAFQIGEAHGQAFGAQIRGFLDDDLCRLNRIFYHRTTLADLRETINRYGEAIARDTPALFDEIRGLAAGAEIDIEESLLLQVRREVMGYNRIPTGGDCTTLCRIQPRHAVLAQTIDLNGDLDDHMMMLDITHASGRRVLVLSFAGLLGYLGMNSDGLAIGLNLVLGGTWRPGLPPYLAIRHLLDSCSDVETCIYRLSQLHIASSRALTICDRRSAVTVEILDGKMAVMSGSELVHTNHFLTENFAAADAVNPFARNSSVRRLTACRERLEQVSVAAASADYMEIFCHEPIRVRGNGDIRRERTVGTVIMSPEDGVMHVRRGDPALAATQTFHMHD
ncbi:C45 family autoproteolytic acyltransferase/hydolase [uncultured Bradyrhizobium sp.]|uniref:C45 family autoproteolytic acyltransferase/hydolase n=1 Tax=uncultured Bradyrhizobium sp. TaxID=199684 RepID=UPI0035CBBCDD